MFFIYFISQIGCILYASLFEWLLHRFVMHKPFFGFTYAYDAHARVHHWKFGSGPTYLLQDKKDAYLIPMAWWNGPVLIFLAASPLLILVPVLGLWWPFLMLVATLAVYYSAYEFLHFCMHLPDEIELSKPGLYHFVQRMLVRFSKLSAFRNVFRRLNGHHLLHHRYMDSNFNVVFPFWDWVLGTLLLRAKRAFMQPQGRLVPDVQPLPGAVQA